MQFADPVSIIVYSLYNARPHRCPTCALRFVFHDQLNAHMDEHFHKNRRENAVRKSGAPVSRMWYPSADEALLGTVENNAVPWQDKPVEMEQEKPVSVVAVSNEDEDFTRCARCMEHVPQRWVQEDEEWVFDNAMRYRGAIYHRDCALNGERFPWIHRRKRFASEIFE